MIKDFLPEYYEAHGKNPYYNSLRSIVIDGHEIAWMEFKGTRNDKSNYTGRLLYCECDFTKGVGWNIEKGKVFSIHRGEKCLKRKTAIHLRHLELQKEYGSFKNWIDHHHPKTKEEWVKIFKKTFRFTGGEIVNEFFMSIGYLPGAHVIGCPIYEKLKRKH